jgi:hypothetical protein
MKYGTVMKYKGKRREKKRNQCIPGMNAIQSLRERKYST